MPLHEVAAEGLIGGHGGLEIHFVANGELAYGGFGEGFCDDIEAERLLAGLDNGQAGAADADGIAVGWLVAPSRRPSAAVNGESDAKGLLLYACNRPGTLYESCKHARQSSTAV